MSELNVIGNLGRSARAKEEVGESGGEESYGGKNEETSERYASGGRRSGCSGGDLRCDWRAGSEGGCTVIAGDGREASAAGVALQSLHIGANFRGMLITKVPIFLETLVDDSFELLRKVGISRTGSTGVRFKIASKIVAVLSPRNGNCPVAISYKAVPNENKSVLRLVPCPAPAPATCRRQCPRCCRDWSGGLGPRPQWQALVRCP